MIYQFSVGVEVSVRKTAPRFIRITTIDKPDDDLLDCQTSQAFILGLLITEIIGSKLPHNLIILDQGREAIVYPRSHNHRHFGWLELFGASRYTKVDMIQTHWKDTSVEESTIVGLVSSLQKALASSYKVKAK